LSELYSGGREGFLDGSISWLVNDIRAVLLSSKYKYNKSDRYLSDIPEDAQIDISEPLKNKQATNGVAEADDVIFPMVEGDTVVAIAVVADRWGLLRLISYIDIPDPVKPNGGDILIEWDDGQDKIFRI